VPDCSTSIGSDSRHFTGMQFRSRTPTTSSLLSGPSGLRSELFGGELGIF
jgi:hypothetical protein